MAHVTIEDTPSFVRHNVTTSDDGPFTVPFAIFDEADLTITVDGVDIGTAFSFTPTGSVTGGYQAGTVTLDTAVENAEVVIYRNITPARTSDYGTGPLPREAVNNEFDKMQAQIADLRRDVERAYKADFGDTLDEDVAAAIEEVGAIAAEIEQVANIDAEVVIVAGAIADVETVADNIDDVRAVADILPFGAGWLTALTSAFNAATLAAAHLWAKATWGVLTVDTLAELTALTSLSERVTYRLRGRGAKGDGGGGDFYFVSGSSTTANGGTIFADDAATGRLFRLYDKGDVQVAWWGLTIGSTSGSVPANNVAAFEAAMICVAADGGGTAWAPPTGTSYIAINAAIDNTYSNVLVRGAGRSDNHDVGASPIRGGTTLLATAAVTALRHRTISGSASTPREDGGGFVDINLHSNSVMTRGLHVTSRRFGRYRLYIYNCEGSEAVLFDCLVTGATLGEAADNQDFELDIALRLVDTVAAQACHGVRFAGASNANSSLNRRGIKIAGTTVNGDLVRYDNADNLFTDSILHFCSGTGRPFFVSGTRAANATYTEGLAIGFLTSTNAGYVEGTDTGGVVTAATIRIDHRDIANSTPRPTGGTGAVIVDADPIGNAVGWGYENLVAGEARSSVVAGKAAVAAGNSLYVYNVSEGHQVLSDGTNVWGFRIAGGNLAFTRFAGSGKLNLPDASVLLINGAQVSVGAADSGGAGYKLLRVPN